ncbi:MAG TPA: NAD-dependent epimerase/dehydratase family protein, partial [Chloroflexota bacterium]
SHLVDLLVGEGWQVRVLDALEPQTHRHGAPAWANRRAQLCRGSVTDRAALREALAGIDVVFHQAAYGGYMPDIAKYFLVNSYGTALLLETIRDQRLPVRKVLVASSQVVYSEGAAICPAHGRVFPPTRPLAQLERGDWEVHCPTCRAVTTPTAIPEDAPIGGGDLPYVLTKVDTERMALAWGRQTGIPTVALRYSCTYGPRQSIFNPYTGVIAIFATRLLAGQPPVLYEDGNQTRDFCFVEDVARANLLAASSDALDGQPVNVGSGVATTIRDVARMVADGLGVAIEPVARGEFRPGEIRYLTSDVSRARAVGYRPSTDIAAGIGRYLDWIRRQGDVRDYFAVAEQVLKERRIVQRVEG